MRHECPDCGLDCYYGCIGMCIHDCEAATLSPGYQPDFCAGDEYLDENEDEDA